MGNTTSRLSVEECKNIIGTANLSAQTVAQILENFTSFNLKEPGYVTAAELRSIPALAENPVLEHIFAVLDVNGDGRLSLLEFILLIAKLSSSADEYHKVRFVFDVFDVDRDGYLSREEIFLVMKVMVGNNLSDANLIDLVNRSVATNDADADEKLSYAEFSNAVKALNLSERLEIDV